MDSQMFGGRHQEGIGTAVSLDGGWFYDGWWVVTSA
jgi:hypothetical protein